MRLRVIVFALVAIAVAVGLVLPSAGAKPPKPVKVKAGQSFSVACPSGYTALGGTVEWYNKDGQLVGTSPGTVVGTSTVMFGPAPAGTTTAVTELNCQPPDTTTTAEPTTTSSTTTTTVAPTTTTAEPTTTSSTTTTTVAPTTTTLPGTIFVTGSATFPTDGEPHIFFGFPFVPPTPTCPAGTVVDMSQSSFVHASDVTIDYYAEVGWIVANMPYLLTPDEDYQTRTIDYSVACVPA
jgi:hypothetical protein